MASEIRERTVAARAQAGRHAFFDLRRLSLRSLLPRESQTRGIGVSVAVGPDLVELLVLARDLALQAIRLRLADREDVTVRAVPASCDPTLLSDEPLRDGIRDPA